MTKEHHVQLKNLGKVYAWYQSKLENVGLGGSNNEKEEQEIMLNPGKIEEIARRKEERCATKRNQLLNESFNNVKLKKMFDNEERTEHRDIGPAKYRLTDYKRKSLGKIFN